MSAAFRTSTYALADLALALTRSSARVEGVCETAVRAAAEMLGDGAAVQLVGDDGSYDTMISFHPDADRSRLLAETLTRRGAVPDDPYSQAMRATRRPVLLSPLTRDRLVDLTPNAEGADPGLSAALLCPLIADNTYLGFLLVARTVAERTYTDTDAELIRDIAGELALALASARSLERLRISEDRYRRVLESIPEGVLQIDAAGITTFANQPGAALLGLPREQLVGLPLRGFLDDRGQRQLARWLADADAPGSTGASTGPASGTATGPVSGTAASQASGPASGAASGTAVDPAAGPAAEPTLGTAAGSATGAPIPGAPMPGAPMPGGPVAVPAVGLAAGQPGPTDGSAVADARVVRADGSTRSVRLCFTPLQADHGQPGSSLCMITDRTDHIDARGLKRQLDHLRRLDSMGQLIGGIAHDLNNLLTIVGGSADMIAGAATPGSSQHHHAAEIVHAAVKGRALAHQLLAFGRGGSRTETIRVPDLLDDVRPLFARTMGEHIHLDVSHTPDVWPVRAERGPLQQVLVNLAANARDAMLRGGALTMQVSNAVVVPGELDDPAIAGRFVRLVIADTGGGMDENTRQRALEPFFTTKSAAVGLGLATAASVLRGIGGHITLQSEPRIGTTVQLYLPAAAASPDPAPAATLGAAGMVGTAVGAAGSGTATPDPLAAITGADPATAAGTAAPTAAGRGTILAVEDQPELAQLIRRLLEPAGYAVTVFTDAEAALAGFDDGPVPDLLITDVVMPGMTGPDLAAALRARHPSLPVIYMSGYTAAALGPQVQLDDNSALVEKPFNRSTLLTAVQRFTHPAP
jgi:signal transduction histidine kinase/CheY-like chemotaxis protein/PAS domain-containing protein